MLEGLSSEHHNYLNIVHLKDEEERRKIFNKFRRLYVNNSLALEQIDKYDWKSPYRTHLEEFCDALKSKNEEKMREEKEWIKEHYPLTSS
jgi:uncharacterized iron-regulated protein